MTDEELPGPGVKLFVAALALASLLLPAALLLLLAAGGLLKTGAVSSDAGRLWALGAGMLLGGFGLCTAPLGLPLVLKWLFVPRRAALFISGGFASAVAGSAALIGLAVYAWLRLAPAAAAPGAMDGQWLALSAMALAAGVGVRVTLEFGRFRRQLLLGKTSLDPEELICRPGEKAQAWLNTEKKAVSVSAELKLYDAEAELKASRAAQVGEPQAAPVGWRYSITWTLPEEVPVPPGGSWELSVEARGRGGAVYNDSRTIETGR